MGEEGGGRGGGVGKREGGRGGGGRLGLLTLGALTNGVLRKIPATSVSLLPTDANLTFACAY